MAGKKSTLILAAVFFLSLLLLSGTVFSLTVDDSIELYERGQREYQRGDYDEAIEYFDRIINEAPENALTQVSMYFLGKSYQNLGKTQKAETTFNRLIDKYRTGEWVTWAKKELGE
ncbi:MAG: tetratricopeptide repeat protein [Candidatus Omnitrophica bacterium]|nr:tetratricopeptide repeat protein [Candidatus Omnitrophota bacterium]